jgi:large subunit ribosomal protein L21
MKFAVISTGGKQYKVAAGDVLKVEKISDALKVGDKVVFDQVLLTDDGSTTKIGTPTISGAKVEAVTKEIGRNQKVIVIKFKQKSRYFKKNGHRQPFSKVEIKSV